MSERANATRDAYNLVPGGDRGELGSWGGSNVAEGLQDRGLDLLQLLA